MPNDSSFMNHVSSVATNRWARRRFVAQWRRIYADDPHWVPPYYPSLRRALDPGRDDHVTRMAPVMLHVEALRRRERITQGSSGQTLPLAFSPIFEEPVAAAVGLLDSRQDERTGYLALLHCVNDRPSLERLWEALSEALWARGCQRLVGPTGLSIHLAAGLLQDHWNIVPPLHTPYDPPYMAELIHTFMRPVGQSRLFYFDIPSEPPPAPPNPAHINPLDPARLTADWLPLLIAAFPSWDGFPPPDAMEAAFLLRWMGRWHTFGWVAEIDGQPAGFILLQPDLAPRLRRAGGGRRRFWRSWLVWASKRPTLEGRVLAGAVLPRWRGRGIGRQLLHKAIHKGCELGWTRLSIGPIPTTAPACAFLLREGGLAHQSYVIYQRDL